VFLPIGDTPNPRNFTPWVNYSLLAINIAVYIFISLPLSSQGLNPNDPMLGEFLNHLAPRLSPSVSLRQVLAQISQYDLFVFIHGYKPAAPEFGDLFFSLFLHGGLLHLAGNMLFLWIYGDNVEHRLGRFGYLLTYLGTGILATLFFSVFAGSSMTPLVGASGAISGILGLYFLLFPRNKVKVFLVLFPIFFNVILLPARWVLGFFILIDNLLPFAFGAQSGVAYGAHIGGFLGGLAVAWLGERFAWRWPWSDNLWRKSAIPQRKKPPAGKPGESNVSEIRNALRSNSPEKAMKAFAAISREDMAELTSRECVILADWLDDAGHPIAASNILKRCIAGHPNSEKLAEVYLMLGLMRLKQGQPTAAYQHLLSVFDYDPDPQTAERAREALSKINIYRGA